MKQCIAIAVFFAIMVQTFSKDLIVAHFYLNRAYIAARFCENKDNPEMHCRGRCHLKKTLKKDQQDSRLLLQDRHDVTLYCYHDPPPGFLPIGLFSDREPYPVYNDPAQQNVPNPVFHPPAAIV